MGESITVIIEGKKVDLKIAGTGQSPEYIYAIRGVQNIYPDPQTFEVAYMPYDVMESLFARKGMVNDISFTFSGRPVPTGRTFGQSGCPISTRTRQKRVR